MENYGLTKETIETITEKAEKIMSAYDSYKLNAREWENYGKHRVYVTVGGYYGSSLKRHINLLGSIWTTSKKSLGNINAGNVPPRRSRGQKEKENESKRSYQD